MDFEKFRTVMYTFRCKSDIDCKLVSWPKLGYKLNLKNVKSLTWICLKFLAKHKPIFGGKIIICFVFVFIF